MKKIIIVCVLLLMTVFAYSQSTIEDAHKALRHNKFDEAIELYSKALATAKDYAPGYYGRGYAYFNKGNFEKAISDFDKAITLDVKYADAYQGLGLCYLGSNVFNQAIENLKKAIELKPDFADAYYGLGNVYFAKGEYAIALVQYDIALTKDNQYGDVFYARGATYRNLKKDSEALADFQNYLKLNPDGARAEEAKRLISVIAEGR